MTCNEADLKEGRIDSEKYGLFAGLTGLDIVYYQGWLPNENKKSKTNNYHIYTGGPAANAAITYAMLGGRARLITCIGQSEIGEVIRKELLLYGVELIDCAENQTIMPNISSISVNTDNGSRTIWSGQQPYNQNLPDSLSGIMKDALFCLSDCNQHEIAIKVLQQAKKYGIPIVLDAGSWKEQTLEYLKLADEVIASEDCRPPEDISGHKSNGMDFIDISLHSGVRNTAVTCGEKPIRWKSNRASGYIEPISVTAKDTLGAGDIFHGAYCYFRYVKKMPFPDSLKHASKVASFSVEYFGPREGVIKYHQTNMI